MTAPAGAVTAASTAPDAVALVQEIQRHGLAAVRAAVAREGADRFRRLFAAIDAYRRHPYRRDLPEPPVLWRTVDTRVLDYRTYRRRRSASPPVILVPSLVNRWTILDLDRGNSFARWLAARGVRTFVMDWGDPGPGAAEVDLEDYVDRRLAAAVEVVRGETGARPALVGYCMGGLLALGVAARRPSTVSALALLATPWSFHRPAPERARALAARLQAFEPVMRATGALPVDVLQSLFYALDPLLAVRKFLAFGAMDPDSARARAFVVLEDWVNGGAPLAAPVAREALGEWYGRDTPARLEWAIAGEPVDPAGASVPTLVAMPVTDRIVPPEGAAAVLERLPCASRLDVPAGHVGMMAGHRAPDILWGPLARWLGDLV